VGRGYGNADAGCAIGYGGWADDYRQHAARFQACRQRHRVSIGAGAMIIGSVTIGDDAVIGPNAVVMMNVPDGATATAMPARVIPAAPEKQPEKDKAKPPAPDDAGRPGASDRDDRAGRSDCDNAAPSPTQPEPHGTAAGRPADT